MRMDSVTRSLSSASSFSITTSISGLNLREPSVETLSSLGYANQDENFIDPQHSTNVLARVQDFACQGLLTDVTLVAGERKIAAHRLLLAAASDYFAAMFTGNMTESSAQQVEILGVDPASLQQLVDYCYTGRLALQEDTVENLMSAACLLQLPAVTDSCCMFLKKLLHPSNCIGIRLFADAQSCLQLRNSARQYTEDNYMEVIKNQEFLLLPSSELVKLLSSDDLNIPSEEVVFQSLLSWLNYDLPNRQCDAAAMLACVRLPLLSPQYIADNIENQGVFRSDTDCHHLILEAMKYHLLPERRSSLQSIRTCPRKATVGYLFAVGGMDMNKGATSIERYDPRTDNWSQIASMNDRRVQFGVAVVEGKLYVVGGRDGLKTLNTVECYDPLSRTWTIVPSMTTHRHGLGVGVLGGPLYAVGGHDGWSYLNTVERWDPSSRQWSYVAPMSTQRSTVGVAVLNNRLYAVGGRDGSCCLRSVEMYDPHTNKWSPVASMCKRRGGVGVGVVNGCLYAVGGHDAPAASNPAQSRFNCMERYDPATDTWSMVCSLSIGRDAIGVCVLGEKLFAVGGYDGAGYLSLVEAYDSRENTWREVASLNTGRGGACVVVVRK